LQHNGDKKKEKGEIREIMGRKKSKMNKTGGGGLRDLRGMTDYLTKGSCHN